MSDSEKLLSNVKGVSEHFFAKYANRPTASDIEALGREVRLMHCNQGILAEALHELLRRP